MKYVFDTEAILKFYLGEDGAPKVLELLKHVQDKKVKGILSKMIGKSHNKQFCISTIHKIFSAC